MGKKAEEKRLAATAEKKRNKRAAIFTIVSLGAGFASWGYFVLAASPSFWFGLILVLAAACSIAIAGCEHFTSLKIRIAIAIVTIAVSVYISKWALGEWKKKILNDVNANLKVTMFAPPQGTAWDSLISVTNGSSTTIKGQTIRCYIKHLVSDDGDDFQRVGLNFQSNDPLLSGGDATTQGCMTWGSGAHLVNANIPLACADVITTVNFTLDTSPTITGSKSTRHVYGLFGDKIWLQEPVTTNDDYCSTPVQAPKKESDKDVRKIDGQHTAKNEDRPKPNLFADQVAEAILHKLPAQGVDATKGKALDLAGEISKWAERRESEGTELTYQMTHAGAGSGLTGDQVQAKLNQFNKNTPSIFYSDYGSRIKESYAELKAKGAYVGDVEQSCRNVIMEEAAAECGKAIEKAANELQTGSSAAARVSIDSLSDGQILALKQKLSKMTGNALRILRVGNRPESEVMKAQLQEVFASWNIHNTDIRQVNVVGIYDPQRSYITGPNVADPLLVTVYTAFQKAGVDLPLIPNGYMGPALDGPPPRVVIVIK